MTLCEQWTEVKEINWDHNPALFRFSWFSLRLKSQCIPCKLQRWAQHCLQYCSSPSSSSLERCNSKGSVLKMASVQAEAGTWQLSPRAPQFWTLNTEHASQLNQIVFISRAFMTTCSLHSCNPHCTQWVCDQHSYSCEKQSFNSRRGRHAQIQHLLCGQCSNASSDTTHALFTHAYVCMCVYSYVCMFPLQQTERKREKEPIRAAASSVF